jgi:hypothetical protein
MLVILSYFYPPLASVHKHVSDSLVVVGIIRTEPTFVAHVFNFRKAQVIHFSSTIILRTKFICRVFYYRVMGDFFPDMHRTTS